MNSKDMKTYESKLLTVSEAGKKIESGDMAFVGPGSSAPIALLEELSKRVDEVKDINLISALLLHPFSFLQSPKFIGKINYHTFFLGPYERAFKKAGNVNCNSVNLSQVEYALEHVYNIDTLIVDVSTPDEDGYMYLGAMGVSACHRASELAKKIIVQVNKHQPQVAGEQHRIHVNDVTWICENDSKLPRLPETPTTEVDEKIAKIIVKEIPDGACLQIGIGALSNAIGYGLENKKDLSVYTEMLTDSMVFLARKGVINGEIKTGFGLGNDDLYSFIEEGKVEMIPVSISNSPELVGRRDNFISINTSLMSDLTGQVCSESLGHDQYSSTGGQLDFVKGAKLSKGGKSFICIASTVTSKDGKTSSTITLNLPPGQAVTVPRSEVMYIVTEYGIADLHCKSISERVKAMINIAHPDFREELTEEAKQAGIL